MIISGSIKISELSPISNIAFEDFFPLDKSSSLTTYRANFSVLNGLMSSSGSVLSASWASSSISSSYSFTASYLVSASYAFTASYVRSASFSNASLISISSSWASSSVSSSYAITSSYALTASRAFNANTASSINFVPATASYALTTAQSITDTLPIGTIMVFASSSTPPNNWLECNGSIVSTASYIDLYNAIKTSDTNATFGYLCDQFGNWNSSGIRFKLPDLRGEFVRGWDHGKGTDSGRSFGSSQETSVKNHYHGMGAFVLNNDAQFILRSWNIGSQNSSRVIGEGTSVYYQTLTSGDVGTTDGIETGDINPRNIALMYCIKYSNAANLINLTGSTLAGDVQGPINNTNVVAIQKIPVTSSAPTVDGQVLTYNSASNVWYPKEFGNNFVSQLPRAYGKIINTGTPLGPGSFSCTSSYNIQNVTGVYNSIDTETTITVNFITPLPSGNYVVVINPDDITITGYPVYKYSNKAIVSNKTNSSFSVTYGPIVPFYTNPPMPSGAITNIASFVIFHP